MDRSDWHGCELVTKHAKLAAEHVADVFRMEMAELLPDLQFFCDSPIEAVFLMWWTAVRKLLDASLGPSLVKTKWMLAPQREVQIDGATYRVDFEMLHEDAEWAQRVRAIWTDFPRVAIELDGHDFHERTREQVSYRNARDRALQGAGWKVFHFSGSEVVRSPTACVFEVHGFLSGLTVDALKRLSEHEKALAPSETARIEHGTNQDDQA